MRYLLTGETTNRLIFKLVDQSYFEDWIEFFKHPEAALFLGVQKDGTPYDQCMKWFHRVEERYKLDLGGMNALIDKNTNEFIGQCGLLIQEVDGLKELEIGYSILPKFWNSGYASEAAIKCRDYAFQNDFTESLISIIHPENIKSINVARKLGMVETKLTVFKEMPAKIFRIGKADRRCEV